MMAQLFDQVPPLGRITDLTGRQASGDAVALICGNQMNFGTLSSPAASKACGPFFGARPCHQDEL